MIVWFECGVMVVVFWCGVLVGMVIWVFIFDVFFSWVGFYECFVMCWIEG